MPWPTGKVPAVKAHRAVRAGQHTRYGLEHRGLPDTVATNDDDRFLGLEMQGEARDDGAGAVSGG
jgi:hypothetical protein